jgi:hypothetical protein
LLEYLFSASVSYLLDQIFGYISGYTGLDLDQEIAGLSSSGSDSTSSQAHHGTGLGTGGNVYTESVTKNITYLQLSAQNQIPNVQNIFGD